VGAPLDVLHDWRARSGRRSPAPRRDLGLGFINLIGFSLDPLMLVIRS